MVTGAITTFVGGLGAAGRAIAGEPALDGPTFIELPDNRYYVVPARDMEKFLVRPPTFEAAMTLQFNREDERAQSTGPVLAGSSSDREEKPPRKPAAMGVRG